MKCVSNYFVGKLHYGALIFQPIFQVVIFSTALESHGKKGGCVQKNRISYYISAFGTFTLLKKNHRNLEKKQVNCTRKNIRQVVLQSWIVQTWEPALYFRKTTKCTYSVTDKCFWKKMQHFRVTYRNRNNGFMFVNVSSNNNAKFSWNGFFIQFNKKIFSTSGVVFTYHAPMKDYPLTADLI